jgi:ABC-type sugar transport system ATPase subunit
VLALIDRLRTSGHTVLLISHNMRDVILKGGRKVQDRSMASLQAEDLRRMIFEAA